MLKAAYTYGMLERAQARARFHSSTAVPTSRPSHLPAATSAEPVTTNLVGLVVGAATAVALGARRLVARAT